MTKSDELKKQCGYEHVNAWRWLYPYIAVKKSYGYWYFANKKGEIVFDIPFTCICEPRYGFSHVKDAEGYHNFVRMDGSFAFMSKYNYLTADELEYKTFNGERILASRVNYEKNLLPNGYHASREGYILSDGRYIERREHPLNTSIYIEEERPNGFYF